MTGLDPDNPDDILRLAGWLHEEYERAARRTGWQTQDGTSVPFEELPEKNAKTMLHLAVSLLTWYDVEKSDLHKRIDSVIEDAP